MLESYLRWTKTRSPLDNSRSLFIRYQPQHLWYAAMIYKFLLGIAIAFLLASFYFPKIDPSLLSCVSTVFPDGIQGWVLLLLTTSAGVLFVLHGYPKLTQTRRWAGSLKMPVFLCFLSSALEMNNNFIA